jgi:Putative transposase/Transposase zinc-binding domain
MASPSPTLGDVIRRFGAALVQQRGGTLTPAHHAVLWTLGRCHTAALGGHLYRCDDCGTERAAYNSCGNRHCPSCLGQRSAQWLEERASELLPVPYFHVVFTMPAEVAALALGNKKVVYSILFRAASETLLEIGADPRHLGATLGFLAILHTWSQTLTHHPHIHCVVPAGGLSPDRTRWVATRRSDFLLPVPVLKVLYRGKFLAYLLEAFRTGALKFAGVTAPLAQPSAFAAFVREQRAKEWGMHVKPPFGSPEQVLKYLARYTHRVAISDHRIQAIEGDSVRFSYRDRKDGDRQRVMTLDGVEFLRRFVQHVLPKGFVRIRYYGLLANRVRADNLARCRELLSAAAPITASASPSPTAESCDDGPRLCPCCGTGRMRRVRTIEPEFVSGSDGWPPVARDTS